VRLPYEAKRSVVATGIIVVAILLGVRAAFSAESPDSAITDPAQWRSIALARAQRAAADVQDPYRQAEVLAASARAQATVEGPAAAEKTIRQALAAAARIQADEFRGWALNEIVLAQIAADDLIGAKQTAESINAARPQGRAYAAIANVHVRLGNLPAAQALAVRIADPVARGDVLRQIVSAHSLNGDIEAARAMLPGIEDQQYAAMAFGDVAVARLDNGNLSGAYEMATRARKANRNEVYGRIALAQAENGDFSGALKSMQLIKDPLARALVQGRVALQRVEQQDVVAGRALLADALAAIRQLPEKPQPKLAPAAQLARWQVVAGDINVARETLRGLRSEAELLPPGRDRDEVLDYIGRSQARAGDTREAVDAAKKISDRVMRALLVRDAVSLDSGATTASAKAWAREFSDPLVEAAAQFGVISMQTFRGGRQPSLETIDAAHDAVRRIDDRELLPAAYAALAAVRARAGDVPGSRAIFQEALDSAEALARSDQIAAACIRIVEALDERLMFLGRAVDKMDEAA
jgi:tetratricopeptide (TPR) repeat protein